MLQKQQYQGNNAVHAVSALCEYISKKHSEIPISEWAFGTSKIFVASPKTIFFLEELREEKIDPVGYAQKVKEHERMEQLADRQEAKMRVDNNRKKKGCTVQ